MQKLSDDGKFNRLVPTDDEIAILQYGIINFPLIVKRLSFLMLRNLYH